MNHSPEHVEAVQWNGAHAPGTNGHPVYVAIPQHAAPPAEESTAAPRVGMVLAALRRRWFLASVLGLILGSAAAAATWSLIPDTYTAFAELLVRPNRSFIHDPRATRQGVVDVLTYKQSLAHWAKYQYVLEAALRDPDVAGCSTLRTVEDPKEWLRKNIQLSYPGHDFLRIATSCASPQDAVLIVNAFTDAFMTEVIDRERLEQEASLEKQHRFLQQEKEKLAANRSKLLNLDKTLAASAEQANEKLRRNSEQILQVTQMIADLQMRILDAQLRLRFMEAEQQQKAQAAANGASEDGAGEKPPETPEFEIEVADELVEQYMTSDPEYKDLASEAHTFDQIANAFENRYKAGHPIVAEKRKLADEAQAKLDTFKKENMSEFRERVIAQIKARQLERQLPAVPGQLPKIETYESIQESIKQYEFAKAHFEKQRDALEISGETFTSQWVEREALAAEIEKLARDVDSYESIIRAREVEAQNTPEPVEIGQRATLPKTPDQSKRIKMSAMAGGGAFGLAALLVLWLEFRVRRVSSVSELKQDLRLPLMASIPIIPRRMGSGALKSGDHRAAYWHSVLTESFDSARTLLLRSAEVHSMKAFMITSATGGEGKTTLSCHLATSLSRSGRKTLLIDGDIRRPSIHRVFNIVKDPGLCGVLQKEATLDEAVEEVLPGLWVLSAGKVSQDVLATLAQGGMEEVIEQARKNYDFVLVDSSPLLPVTDAALMAQYCDSVLFSLRRDVSRVPKVAAAIEKMNMLGVKILGAVAIGLDGTANNTYRYPYSADSYYTVVRS